MQAAPDHPWVSTHPEWFTTRADGSIAYAENPPKKYQDIYPINFDNDPEGIYAECLRIVRHWIDHGVTIFRVDNPHTKPVQFWEWLLATVRAERPDVIFLAEAFTRPAMMHTLGKIGFHQSYTYFTWRNEKWEIEEYLDELAHQSSDYFRPNFFTNTQDILTAYLQYGGPSAFTIRAVLASMASPTYGIYSGFELFEHVALRPGSEEYLNSEKYQYRPRDLTGALERGEGLGVLLRRLNEIRRRASRAAAVAQPHGPPHRRRRCAGVLQERDRAGRTAHRHGARGAEPRPARNTGDEAPIGHARAGARMAGHHRRRRTAHRSDVALARGQLRPARPGSTGTHLRRAARGDPGRTRMTGAGDDPSWFKRAVFYEVLVRSFSDSNADGAGDLRGLTDKLDYLQWLGVDCLWLPPFFTSPLRDGGYDVSRSSPRSPVTSARSTTSSTSSRNPMRAGYG